MTHRAATSGAVRTLTLHQLVFHKQGIQPTARRIRRLAEREQRREQRKANKK